MLNTSSLSSSLDAGSAASATSTGIEILARIGYAAKGAVYSVVGILAFQAARGAGGDTGGTRNAISEIGSQPFGKTLLIITAVGLVGYVVWRFVQAIADTEDKGNDASGLAMRAGFIASGITYAALAYTAGRIVWGGSGGGGSSTRDWTASVLSQPFGQVLVGLFGAIIIGVGLYHFYRAYNATFMKHYKSSLSGEKRRWAKRIGQFGLSARGVTFLIIGGFFIQAALRANAAEAKGLGGALQTLAAQPYGAWLLGIVAAGFIAYGIYCFSRARYRHFSTH
jgi:hypothetical protein